MKLLVHNFLTSKFLKGVQTGFPLKLVANDVKVIECELDAEFITRTMTRINYAALREAAIELEKGEGLPETLPETFADDEKLVQLLHHLLTEVDVGEGTLICPETGREFPIKDGIPNMLAREDEVAN